MPTTTKRKLAVSLNGGVVLVLAAGLLTLLSVERLETSARAVAHAFEMRTALQEVRTRLAEEDAALARRAPAARTTAAFAATRDALARVSALAASDAGERHALADAERLFVAREASRAAGDSAGSADVGTRFAAALDRAQAGERALIESRLAAQELARISAAIVILVLIGTGGALGLVASRAIGRDLERVRVAEIALREAEHRFHAMFDQAFQSTLLLTPAGEVAEANDSAIALHAGGRDGLVRHLVWELPAWGARGAARLRAAVTSAAEGGFVRLEESAASADGIARDLDLSLKPMRDADGGVAMLILEGRDISERKAAEAALRASEAKFSGIMAIAADAVITIDERQRVIHFNRGAEEIFGYRADEMIGQPLDALLPPATREAHAGHVARFGQGPDVARRMGARREVAGVRRNGEQFPAEASISKLESEGRLLFTVLLRDITDRKRAEDRQRFLARASDVLASSLDHHQTLAEVARLALPTLGDACIVDVDGDDGMREVAVAHRDPARESAMRQMRRRHVPDANPRHPMSIVRSTRRPIVVPVIDDAYLARTTAGESHAQTVRELEVGSAIFVPLVARDHFLGVLSYYRAARNAFTDDDLGLATELAQRAAVAIDNARLYDAARHASAARDEVLAVVSHDLRNPLSTIGMCAGALLDPEPISAEGVRSMGETIRISAAWAQRIIRDLLDLTSIEAGRLSLARTALPVAPLLERVRGVMRVQAQDAGVALVVSVDGALPDIDVDPERLLQVLLNLLGNALQFTPRDGTVTLRATGDGARDGPPAFVRFSVEDTGVGIAPDVLPHVFDRYWQLHRSGRAGAGLGLAIAKGIVEAHGGRIEAASTPGAGATFSFTIPVSALDRRGAAAPADALAAPATLQAQ